MTKIAIPSDETRKFVTSRQRWRHVNFSHTAALLQVTQGFLTFFFRFLHKIIQKTKFTPTELFSFSSLLNTHIISQEKKGFDLRVNVGVESNCA